METVPKKKSKATQVEYSSMVNQSPDFNPTENAFNELKTKKLDRKTHKQTIT